MCRLDCKAQRCLRWGLVLSEGFANREVRLEKGHSHQGGFFCALRFAVQFYSSSGDRLDVFKT